MARLINRFGAGFCGAITLAGWGQGSNAQNISTYGTPGLIDMPTAEVMPDGELVTSTFFMQNVNRNTITFQLLPRVYGSFRYGFTGEYGPGNGPSNYDRSFDLHFLLREETARGPAFAIGIRDIVGTGQYSGEYIVASKTVAERLRLTVGMGWGRFAGRNSFTNPLSIFGDRFKTRPAPDVGQGGTPTWSAWFRGPASLFGGLEYKVNENLSLLAEYSPDLYTFSNSSTGFTVKSPLNVGLSYRFDNGVVLSGYYMYGTTLGAQLTYALNPKYPKAPGGQGKAPPALVPIDQVAAASWNLEENTKTSNTPRRVLQARLADEGIRLIGYEVSGGTAIVEIENNRYGASAEAIGRTNRVMANTLSPSVEDFTVVLSRQGIPISSVKTRRQDLYELENDLEGSWGSLSRAVIADAVTGIRPAQLEEAFPRFDYRIGPYLDFAFFDPDRPFLWELGVDMSFDYKFQPGLGLSGEFSQPIVGTLDQVDRVSDSVLPRVRSDWSLYTQESDFRIDSLTADYFWRPSRDLFGRVSAGYLEEMFGGVSAEVLWAPEGSRVALGAEVNYALQRDFDMLFGFQSYDVVTGHASLYYDAPGDYFFQVDAGRYLAGDWGATFSIDREFNNGFKIGAFFTLTDVSSDEFGEGSFDKGIRIEVPLSWMTGRPSRDKFTQIIRPVLRDGGARLNNRNRLYELTRSERGSQLAARWGRFFR